MAEIIDLRIDVDVSSYVPVSNGFCIPVAGEVVFSKGVSPTSWTDLDCSGAIGANAALVILQVEQFYVLGDAYRGTAFFRCNGSTLESYRGASCCRIESNPSDEKAIIIVNADANGIIEWYTGEFFLEEDTPPEYEITVLGYIPAEAEATTDSDIDLIGHVTTTGGLHIPDPEDAVVYPEDVPPAPFDDLDLSSAIGGARRAVVWLKVEVTTNSNWDAWISFRSNGDAYTVADTSVSKLCIHTASSVESGIVICNTDQDGIVEWGAEKDGPVGELATNVLAEVTVIGYIPELSAGTDIDLIGHVTTTGGLCIPASEDAVVFPRDFKNSSYQDLDLSSAIGEQKAIVWMKVDIDINSALDVATYFRENGSAEDISQQSISTFSTVQGTGDNAGLVICNSDAEGVVEWKLEWTSSGGDEVIAPFPEVTVLGYIPAEEAPTDSDIDLIGHVTTTGGLCIPEPGTEVVYHDFKQDVGFQDLDLSAAIGEQAAVVWLKVEITDEAVPWWVEYYFRQNGSSDDISIQSVSAGRLGDNTFEHLKGTSVLIIVSTDENGVVEWKMLADNPV